jgi:hypothetical protein
VQAPTLLFDKQTRAQCLVSALSAHECIHAGQGSWWLCAEVLLLLKKHGC